MAQAQDWRYSYFYATLTADVIENNSSGGYSRVSWSLVLHTSRLNVRSSTWNVYIDGQYTACTLGSQSLPSGSHDLWIGDGVATIWHTNAKTITCSFDSDVNWNISGRKLGGMGASCTLDLPQLAVAPTPPNSVSVSGGSNGWLSVDNPTFNVSWSGASAGTYTITQYNIDVTKNNWGSITTPATKATSGTSGSINNVSAASLSLSGGETVKVRVAMMTTRGDWLLSYWGGSFKMYSNPTAPTTFNVPSSQEIDTAFNISWSGAKAGSNGIAGYDLEIRAYNGSSWTDWVRLLNCKNQTSYSSKSPKSLNINGVSYATYGENVQFQYRIRTSDGTIATSSWATKTMTIKINAPTSPRK